MSFIIKRSYLTTKSNLLCLSSSRSSRQTILGAKRCCSDRSDKEPSYSSSTIIVEKGSNVQELPVIIRKMKFATDIALEKPPNSEKNVARDNDSLSYNLIKAEFQECLALRDVFSLLSKCTKITPNIALGAMERIHYLEKNPHEMDLLTNNVNIAKNAIIDKLLKVVMKTEDTQSILNALYSNSSFIEPYKHQLCDEMVMRTIENKLPLEELCTFVNFLVINKSDKKYSKIIDKLWVGFVERENEINGKNIVKIFQLLPHLKKSKKTMLQLLEQKLPDLWMTINTADMQDILNMFIQESGWCENTFAIAGGWLTNNIQSLDEDSFLEIVTKFTTLNYNDEEIQKVIEKYVKLKSWKINSPILLIALQNYCMQFRIRSPQILNSCCEYFLLHHESIPHHFLKSFVYPYGYLNFSPNAGDLFWNTLKNIVERDINKLPIEDLLFIILSFIYNGKHPKALVNKLFGSDFLSKHDVTVNSIFKKLCLIDTSMSLECEEYTGPMLPKHHWAPPVPPEGRIRNLLGKIKESLIRAVGGENKISTFISIPYLPADETYLIDIMVHPASLRSDRLDWKLKSAKNENIAMLIHLPEHYCSDNVHLIGPQEMKRRHLCLLGMKVASVRYSTMYDLSLKKNLIDLDNYLIESIRNAESCL